MSGTDARLNEPRPSLAGLVKGTPEFRVANAAYQSAYYRDRYANDPSYRARRLATRRTHYAANRAALNAQRNERQQQLKAVLVEFFGGACHVCGYSEHQAALHFHHTDPSRKTRMFNTVSLTVTDMTSLDFLEELATCKLLCANCHAVQHAN